VFERFTDRARRVVVLAQEEARMLSLSGYPVEEIPTTGGTPASGTKRWTPASGPSCPWCSLPLEGALAYRTMVAAPDDDEGDPISLFLLYCRGCGGIVRTSLD
jgi:hypothetical protein